MAGLVSAAVNSTAADLTARLHHHLREEGWPSDVVRHISVGTNGKATWSSDVDRQVMDLEYGTQHQTPKGSLGKFFNDHQTLARIQRDNVVPLLRQVSAKFGGRLV